MKKTGSLAVVVELGEFVLRGRFTLWKNRISERVSESLL